MARDFGQTLKHLRHALSLSQEQFAIDIGSTQRHISFLETGRTRPTRAMLGRIMTALRLSHGQRAELFAASGFHNPYQTRDMKDKEMQEALDMIDTRILSNWPFPAFALDSAWNILRANPPAQNLLAPFVAPGDAGNLLSVFISPAFAGLVDNWEQVSTSFYFRTVAAAEKDADLRSALADAQARGIFEHIPRYMTEADEVPLYHAARLRMPDGTVLELASVVAHLAASVDAAMSGIEIEFMFPMDDTSDEALR